MPQDITSTAMSSHLLEGSEHQDLDIVALSADQGISQILSTTSTHAPALTLATIPTSPLNMLLQYYNASVTSVQVSNFLHFPPPSTGSFILTFHPTDSAIVTGVATLTLNRTLTAVLWL